MTTLFVTAFTAAVVAAVLGGFINTVAPNAFLNASSRAADPATGPPDEGRIHGHHDTGAASRPQVRQRSGPVVAALLAAGVGCAALGLCVVLAAASLPFETLMDLYAPAGPLTGKTSLATVAYLGSWAVLHRRLRDRDVDVAGG